MRTHLFVAASVITLTLLGYVQFPGHTYLQSDTQVYVPMLERLWDPTVLQNDFMVQRPHMGFTIYDEVALALRRLTGLGFQQVLAAQQLLFRALGVLGIFLIASSLKLSSRMALLTAAIFALGATIWGPTVLTVEYEPVPRGFALPLLFLALGLLAHGRETAATVVASIAVLFHGTTTIPFWLVYFAVAGRRRLLGVLHLFSALLVLLLLSWLQPSQPLLPLGRLGPWWEKMLRLRATYIWVSLWFSHWYWHYAILGGVAAAAFWRLRKQASPALRPLLVGLPLLGILSVPTSYVLLEVFGLALAPHLQPTRMVLWVTAMAGLLATVAAIRAAQAGRWIEGFLWFLPVFVIPTGNAIQHLLLPHLGDPVIRRRLLLVVLLSAGGVLAAWADATRRRWSLAAWTALVLLPSFLLPGFGKVENYPPLHNRDTDELANWARASTPEDAVFLFPDARRELHPGLVRALALRAVYVDWKSGGQGNYFPEMAREWWQRWQAVMAPRFKPGRLTRYAGCGIDYVVVLKNNRSPLEQPVFENASYAAYRIR